MSYIVFHIKQIRREKNISLKQLSRKSGISSSQINDIENNNKMPSIFTLELIAKALNEKVTDLYTIVNN